MMIKTIEWPAPGAFIKEYIEAEKPVVIAEGLANCAASSWTPEKLCSMVGHKRVSVAISSDNGVFGYTRTGAAFSSQEMEFSAAVSLMSMAAATTTNYYMMQVPVRQRLPELESQISFPPVVDEADFRALNFWLSAAGNITPLHYDSSNNFLAQIHGRKEVTLFSPDQAALLYPLDATALHPYVSQVNYLRPDLEQFPRFTEANGTRLMLEAGDVLFIPAFWWHGVRTLEMSISLNFWWNILPSQFLAPAAIDTLVERYDRTRFKMDLGARDLIEAAKYALLKNLFWAASLLAAAGLEQHLRNILVANNVSHKAMPGRLDLLNTEVAKSGHRTEIDPKKLEAWTRLVRLSRLADDTKVSAAEVSAMVKDIAKAISGSDMEAETAAAAR